MIIRGQEEVRNVSVPAERRRKPKMHQNYSASKDWREEARGSEDEVVGRE
jgi:hypothetical protein